MKTVESQVSTARLHYSDATSLNCSPSAQTGAAEVDRNREMQDGGKLGARRRGAVRSSHPAHGWEQSTTPVPSYFILISDRQRTESGF